MWFSVVHSLLLQLKKHTIAKRKRKKITKENIPLEVLSLASCICHKTVKTQTKGKKRMQKEKTTYKDTSLCAFLILCHFIGWNYGRRSEHFKWESAKSERSPMTCTIWIIRQNLPIIFTLFKWPMLFTQWMKEHNFNEEKLDGINWQLLWFQWAMEWNERAKFSHTI